MPPSAEHLKTSKCDVCGAVWEWGTGPLSDLMRFNCPDCGREIIATAWLTHEGQAGFMESDKKVQGIVAGIRGGKTHFAVAKAILFALNTPNARIWLVAPTYGHAQSVLVEKFLELTNESVVPKWKELTERSRVDRAWFWNGARVDFKSGFNPSRLKGQKIHLAVLDEAAQMDKDVYLFVLGRTMDYQGNIFITTTPEGMNNWVYEDIYIPWQDGDSHIDLFRFPTFSNPFINPDQIEILKSQYSEKLFQQEIMGEFCALGKRVYQDFDRRKNVSVDADFKDVTNGRYTHVTIGADFNVSPMSWSLMYWEPNEPSRRRFSAIRIFDELVIDNTTVDRTLDKLRGLELKYGFQPQQVEFVCDATGGHRNPTGVTCEALIRARGYKVFRLNANQSVFDGINSVSAKIRNAKGERNLLVHPRCTNIIRMFEAFEYEDNGFIKPQHKQSHINDAVRYPIDYYSPLRKGMRAIQ